LEKNGRRSRARNEDWCEAKKAEDFGSKNLGLVSGVFSFCGKSKNLGLVSGVFSSVTIQPALNVVRQSSK
jgi:hypothetical protein